MFCALNIRLGNHPALIAGTVGGGSAPVMWVCSACMREGVPGQSTEAAGAPVGRRRWQHAAQLVRKSQAGASVEFAPPQDAEPVRGGQVAPRTTVSVTKLAGLAVLEETLVGHL